MQIVIDGYNLVKGSPEFRRLEQTDLEGAREALIQELARYRRLKGHAITVVFDGSGERGFAGGPDRSRGVKVIFSRGSEKADDILKRLAAEGKGGVTVVTSDHDVALFAEKKGAAVIGTAEFAERMDVARMMDLKGSEPEREVGGVIAPGKKGPSRRLSKSRRKAAAAAKKL